MWICIYGDGKISHQTQGHEKEECQGVMLTLGGCRRTWNRFSFNGIYAQRHKGPCIVCCGIQFVDKFGNNRSRIKRSGWN